MKYDILFLSPPLIWGQENRMDIKPPLNLIYLSSYINSKGFKSKIIDVLSEKLSLKEAVRKIIQEDSLYLGLPLYHASLDTVMKLCREVKKYKPEIKIIGGGPSMTIHWEELISQDTIDIGVIGEGEITLEEILLSDENNYDKIDGIAYKKDGKVFANQRRTHMDMDKLPYLDYSLVNLNPYLEYQANLNIPYSIFLTTSRGCGYKCIYCATPQLWPGQIRRYSVERLIDEVKYQTKKFPDFNIGFMDDSFFSNRQYLYEFCKQIETIKINYCCIGRADHLDKELIELLAKTGCHYVALGVETGNQKRQKEIKKYLNLSKAKENVKYLVENNILAKCFFMLGFPDETIEEMMETINFAVDLKKLGMFKFNFFPVVIYPGTELSKRFNNPPSKSKIYDNYVPEINSISDFGEKCITMYSTIPDTDINIYLTREEILELTKLAYNKVDKKEYITIQEIKAFIKNN